MLAPAGDDRSKRLMEARHPRSLAWSFAISTSISVGSLASVPPWSLRLSADLQPCIAVGPSESGLADPSDVWSYDSPAVLLSQSALVCRLAVPGSPFRDD